MLEVLLVVRGFLLVGWLLRCCGVAGLVRLRYLMTRCRAWVRDRLRDLGRTLICLVIAFRVRTRPIELTLRLVLRLTLGLTILVGQLAVLYNVLRSVACMLLVAGCGVAVVGPAGLDLVPCLPFRAL